MNSLFDFRTLKFRFSAMLISTIFLAGCLHDKVRPEDLGNSEIIPFNDAMKGLVSGLNELSLKDQDFGLLVDEINVSFTLQKTNNDTIGVGLKANASTTATTKIESYTIEKLNASSEIGATDTDKATNASDGEAGKSTIDSSSIGTSKSTIGGDTEAKASFNSELSNIVGGEFNASFSSVETADGSNLVNIKFKSLANYPVEKTKLLARLGRLGCIAYLSEILGNQASDPIAVKAAMNTMDSDSRLDCSGNQIITEIDGVDETDDGFEITPK